MRQRSGCYGELCVTAIDREGSRFEYMTANTLTFEAARVMSHLLVGHLPVDFSVTRLGVGTGTVAPVRGNQALGNLVHQQTVDQILLPQPGQTEFVSTLDFITPANGNVLTEAGLMCADGTILFARQVHVGVPKDQNFRLEYRWRLVFT